MDANDRACSAYGFTRSELLALTIKELRSPETLGALSSQWQQTQSEGTLVFETPHRRKDGSTFGNFEKRLPHKPRGYYHEYTVPTPGARDRGARRIIAGSPPESSGEYYYTDDHYRSFRRIKE